MPTVALDLATPLLTPTQAPKREPTIPRWTHSLNEAQGALAQHLDQPHSTGPGACNSASSAGFQCERDNLQTWDDLRALDRPVVVTLITTARRRHCATLAAFTPEQAPLLHHVHT